MSKSVSFARPVRKPQPDADAWVGGAGAEAAVPAEPAKQPVPMKRLTLDVPEELHRRVKSGCAARGDSRRSCRFFRGESRRLIPTPTKSLGARPDPSMARERITWLCRI